MPCGGAAYEPDPLAITLSVPPRCLWCLEFVQSAGECPGLLAPEDALQLAMEDTTPNGCPGSHRDWITGERICLGDGRICEGEDCHAPEQWNERSRLEELRGDYDREEANRE